MAVFCPWSHPVESRSVAVHFRLLPFLSLQLRLLKRQSPPPSRMALCVHSAPSSGTPLQTDRAHPATPTSHQSTFESHRLKDALVSQTPQKLVSQRCDILPLVRPALGPSSTAGWFQLPSAPQFFHRGIWALQGRCLFGGQG